MQGHGQQHHYEHANQPAQYNVKVALCMGWWVRRNGDDETKTPTVIIVQTKKIAIRI